MKKIYLILMLLGLLPLSLVAQQRSVSGKVTDASGTALPGVSVYSLDAAGKQVGTATNARGEYNFQLPPNAAALTFAFLGMKTITEQINGRNVINVSMTANESTLEDVVVVGYGTRRKETLTGSVASISAKEIQTTTNISLAQKIQGKVPGLMVRQLGGEPGTFDNMINIRNFGTPLYVIDGVARDGSSEFQRLNADDIESISFLKDASAAIYGLRAGNGVVIVTTKRGVAGKPNFNYNGVVGLMKPTNVPRMATAAEWMQMRNDADIFGRGAPFLTKDELQKWIDGAPGYESTDWYDAAMKKNTMQQQHNFSASGGTEKTQYFFSFAYADEMGLLKSNDMWYKRFNLRSNITTQLHKNLKAEVLIGGRYDNRTVPGENFFNIFKGTRVTLPTDKVYANNNPLYPAVVAPSNQNPVVLSQAGVTGYNESITRNVQSTVALTYSFPMLQGLSLRGAASYDMTSYGNKDLSKPYTLYTYVNDDYVKQPQRVGTGSISNNYGNNNRVTLQAQLSYQRSFKGGHNVSATAVVEQQQFWGRDAFLKRYYDFYTTDQVDVAGKARMENGGMEYQEASLSYVGRANYDYKGKYMIEFAFRQDGSYRYPPRHKWGFFPLVTGGWRMSEEPFIKENLPVISNLKLRGSYGSAGQDIGNPFQYIPGFSTGGGGAYEFDNGALTNGVASPGIVNENLKWIKPKMIDFGLELGLWRNKLTAEVSLFRRDREGLPAYRNVSLPNTFGGSLPQENLNGDRTQGIEFSIGHNNTAGDFRYGISANFTYARIQYLHVEQTPFTNSYNRWRNGLTGRYNDVVWGYTYAGQFLTAEEIAKYPIQNGGQANVRELPGDFKFVDINNDGVIDGRDELPLFNGANGTNDNQNPSGKNPKVNYGLSMNASYKGFDVNLLFQGAAFYSVRFSEVYAEVMAFRGNTPAYFFDRWHKADPYDPNSEWIPGKWPASRFNGDVGRMYTESSVWRKDASYLRLKSAELGYTVAPRLYRSAGIQRIRVYVSGFNLFTIADSFVKPFDPERLEGLFNAGFNYPLMQSYNFGLNVNF
ncbi:SusC/RagA family TonB-linked outer membrane protein [Chitinophaga lutea]